MGKLHLTCKKATELIERKHLDKISFKNGIKLYFHLIICKACSTYSKHSLLIHKALERRFKKDVKQPEKSIDKLKEKIISKL
jgi:hypothetical protein